MAELKISANTSEVKKSLLDLSRNVKDIGTSQISIFDRQERNFIKKELNKELTTMKSRLKENQRAIKDAVDEQKKLIQGSKEEEEARKKIIEGYKTQAKLMKEMNQLKKMASPGGMNGGGGLFGGLLKGGPMALAAGALLGVGGMALAKGIQGTNQYVQGTSSRNKLTGLGINGDGDLGSPSRLARAGLNEQELIARTVEYTKRLGRQGGGVQSVLQQAEMERAYGLDEGTFSNIGTSLRSSFGGGGANEQQMKLQASILATGMEDAIGPYLETVTGLLGQINENGLMATDELTYMFAALTKDGQRTPEQIAKAFQSVDQSIRSSSGEQNAFLQTAFARAGIGGGTVGSTRLALESGGIFGLNKDELLNRGYNKELVSNFGQEGMFTGMQDRSGAILDEFKRSAGLDTKTNISDVKDKNTAVSLSNLSNKIFGTEGMGGFDALMMLEKVQKGTATKDQFDKRLEEIKEGKNPQLERLGMINDTLAGQTEILTKINDNLLEFVGKGGVSIRNQKVRAENTGLDVLGTNLEASSGTVNAVGGAANDAMNFVGKGGIGEAVYSMYEDMKSVITGNDIGVAQQNIPKPNILPTDPNKGAMEGFIDDMKTAFGIMTGKTSTTVVKPKVEANITVKGADGRVMTRTHK